MLDIALPVGVEDPSAFAPSSGPPSATLSAPKLLFTVVLAPIGILQPVGQIEVVLWVPLV